MDSTTLTTLLADPQRLAALTATELLDSPIEPAFDRFTRLVTRLLDVPVALVSLVTPARQFFKSAIGLADPWAARRETPLTHSFCQYVVRDGVPFVVTDARHHPDVATNAAITDLGVVAYAGVPLRAPDGQVLGALCAIDVHPRVWTPAEVAALEDLAEGLRTELTLRQELVRQQQTTSTLQATLAQMGQLYTLSTQLTDLADLDGILQTIVESAAAILPADRVMIMICDPAVQQVTHLVKGGPGAAAVVTVSWAELQAGLTGWVLRTRRIAQSPGGRPDPRESPAVQARRTATAAGPVLVIPLLYQNQVLGTLTAINPVTAPDFTAAAGQLLETLAYPAAAAIANARLFAQIRAQARTDTLTGVANRRAWEEEGSYLMAQAERAGSPLTLLLLDLDHFKQINDTYGHTAGDAVLQAVATCSAAVLRVGDRLGRLGGEEFGVLLPATPLEAALTVAQRVREAVARATLVTVGGPIRVTVSIGVSSTAGDLDLRTLIGRADTALYAAKAAGRNRVAVQQYGGIQFPV